MRFKTEKEKIISYIYGDMTNAERRDFEEEMNNSAKLKAEVHSLLKTRDALSSSKKNGLNERINTGEIYSNIRTGRTNYWGLIPLWGKAAVIICALFLFLSIINTSISVDNGSLKVSFSLIPKAGAEIDYDKLSRQLTNHRMETYELIKGYVEEQEKNQMKTIAAYLEEYEARAQIKRRVQLENIYTELEKLKINTGIRLLNVDDTLNNFARYISRLEMQTGNERAGNI